MAPRKELSVEKRSAIVAVRQADHTLRDIDRLKKVSVGEVKYTLTMLIPGVFMTTHFLGNLRKLQNRKISLLN